MAKSSKMTSAGRASWWHRENGGGSSPRAKSGEGSGTEPRGHLPFVSISTISPFLQVQQICPQNQLRVVQPGPAGTDGLAEQDESFGTSR